jgi:hypothetical protein
MRVVRRARDVDARRPQFIAAVEAIRRFRYHSWLPNAAFPGWSMLMLIAPLAYIVRPTRTMLVISAIALTVWCLFGLGFIVNHM